MVPSTVSDGARLWGRRAECQQLDGLIATVRGGASGTLLVRGEAGVGKSALLDYLLERSAGCRLVRTAGVESEMELAFAALHQLCGPFLDHMERLPGPQRGALAIAFGLESGPPPDRFLVGLAVLTLLSDVAEAQPVVCLVDDVQWLDRASSQVLGFVARRLGADAVVMIFAVREPWEAADFAGLTELLVTPLRDPDARDLLAAAIPGRLDEPVRERIVAESHGNPLALLELPRAWTPAALAGGFGLPDGASVSAKIEESFRRRVTPLPEDSRRLLLVTAADQVGDPVLIRAAADRLGIPPDADGPARTAGLLEDRVNLRFRHPMVRTVVYQDAPLADRRLVHRALADATDPVLDPDRRAWHLAAAAPGPDETVALELERSADRAQARGGLAAAAAFLRRAVVMTNDPGRRTERALTAAEANFQAGAFDAALGLVAMAEAIPLDDFQRARAELVRGRVAFASGLTSDAAPLLLDAARQLEAFDLELARETYLTAWNAAVTAGQLGGREILVEICRSAQAIPRSQGPPPPEELLLEGAALVIIDGHAAATPILRRAAHGFAEIRFGEVLRWGFMALAASALVWDTEGMLRGSLRQVQLLRDAGALYPLPSTLHILGLTRAWMGDFAGAGAAHAEADNVAAATGNHIAPYTLLRLRALQGREAEAASLIASAIEHAETQGQGLSATYAHWASAVLDNGLGRYEAAASAAGRAIANAIEPWHTMWTLPELVEAAVRSGDVELAVDAVDRLARTTEPSGNDVALGIEARCRALVSDDAAAEELYREAIERLGRTRLRPEIARSHLVYGEWLRRVRRRVDAREQLHAAYDLFVEIGMEAFAERTRRELVATGETVRKRSVDTIDQLTPQELQIARLASDGLTNPEIGAQLFLSRRTVEWHLRKVFDKLEIGSRRELPAALATTRETVRS
jgi:DNA-binding NarL/FixJ family response regulator